MLKVTRLNVTRFSEDGLYLALADLTEADEMHPIIEAELDRRITMEQDNLKRRHERQLETMKLTQQMQSELQQVFAGFKGFKTMVLIENFGQEFVDDYTIDETTFHVFSKVSHAQYSNPDTWECESLVHARRKVAKLIYDRIYNKFMRDPTQDNIELLKRVLGA